MLINFNLDVLALCETRIRDTDPPTVKHSIAPQAFSVLHVHRDLTASHPAGGGLAIIYRDQLGVRPLPRTLSSTFETFEDQLVRVMFSICNRGLPGSDLHTRATVHP